MWEESWQWQFVQVLHKWWEEKDVAITAISGVYSSAPQTEMHAEKVFFITLPLIQCKCHCTYIAYTAKARSQQYCGHIPDRFTVSLALLRITTPHPVLFHVFQKVQGCVLQWSINLKHKQYVVQWGALFKAQVSAPVLQGKKNMEDFKHNL